MAVNLKVRDRSGERVIEMRQDKATFGRSSECTVMIDDTMASREHCRIEKISETEYKLIDLESRNGTRVNGIHINQHKLGHGDQIQIGEVTVVFDHPGLASARPGAGSSNRTPSGQKRSTSSTRSKHSTRRVGRRRGKGAGNELVIVGAVVCLVILIGALLAIFGGGSSDDRGPAQILARAQKYYDVADYDNAEKWADKISASKYPNFHASAQQLKQKIEQARAASEDDERARQAEILLKQAEADEKKGKIKGDKLLAAYSEVIRLYPGTSAAARAKARLDRLNKGGKQDPLADLAQKAAKFIERNEFERAIALYQAYWEKTGDKQANAQIKEIYGKGDRAYGHLHKRAQAALLGGQQDRAREFYQEVKRSFGGKWAQRADGELSKIN